jgi:predicted aconitase with swiveling domain
VVVKLSGTTLHEGHGEGPLLVLDAALSLWGGTAVATGRIVEERHPQHAETLAGRVVAFPSVRGSSSSATVLAEQLRRGVGPSAVLLRAPDTILVLGALVAGELYGYQMPVVLLDPAEFDRLPGTGTARVDAAAGGGVIEVGDRL